MPEEPGWDPGRWLSDWLGGGGGTSESVCKASAGGASVIPTALRRGMEPVDPWELRGSARLANLLGFRADERAETQRRDAASCPLTFLVSTCRSLGSLGRGGPRRKGGSGCQRSGRKLTRASRQNSTPPAFSVFSCPSPPFLSPPCSPLFFPSGHKSTRLALNL